MRAKALLGMAAAALLTPLLGGCRSLYVEATVHNATGGPVTLLEVDYPSASFGKEELPNGADFHYRFKILGNGPTKILWTDADHKERTVPGPELHEGEEGRLLVTLAGGGQATWNAEVHGR